MIHGSYWGEIMEMRSRSTFSIDFGFIMLDPCSQLIAEAKSSIKGGESKPSIGTALTRKCLAQQIAPKLFPAFEPKLMEPFGP